MTDTERKNYGITSAPASQTRGETMSYKKIDGGYDYTYGPREYRIKPGATIGGLKVMRVIETGNPLQAQVIIQPMNADGTTDPKREFMRPISELMEKWKEESEQTH